MTPDALHEVECHAGIRASRGLRPPPRPPGHPTFAVLILTYPPRHRSVAHRLPAGLSSASVSLAASSGMSPPPDGGGGGGTVFVAHSAPFPV